MTEEKNFGGVAQQVIQKFKDDYWVTETAGAEMLLEELSNEARSMIDQLHEDEKQALANDMPGGVAVAEGDRLTLQQAFERLGLITENNDETD